MGQLLDFTISATAILDQSRSPANFGNRPAGSGAYGACFSALFVIAWPALERSSPAPAVVWQAPSKGAAPISIRSVKAIENVLRMVMVLISYGCGQSSV